jgi:uncharacterized protein (DUF2141 family)
MRRILLAMCLSAMPSLAWAASVQVTVQGVRNDQGRVLVALCTDAEFLRPHCAWKASTPAAAGTVTLRIEGVPPGTYAAQAFHDENANGRLDRSLLGLPEEGMGFSNDAPMHMGPPRFAAASFQVTTSGADIAFHLRYR